MEELKNSVQTTIQEDEKETQGDTFSENPLAEKDTETAEKQKMQTKEENAEYARKRREIKRNEELKRARLDAIKEVVPKNPFTNEPILDDDDVEEYLLMKKINDEEKDPIKDYPKYVKELKKSRKTDTYADIFNEKEEFSKSFPNVNVGELQKDALFSIFAKGKSEKMSLAEIYTEYSDFLSSVKETEEIKNALRVASSRAAVGALSDTEGAGNEYYTKEEVAAMSPNEIRKNYEKIRKSQLKW
jgi:hypothetical protein